MILLGGSLLVELHGLGVVGSRVLRTQFLLCDQSNVTGSRTALGLRVIAFLLGHSCFLLLLIARSITLFPRFLLKKLFVLLCVLQG